MNFNPSQLYGILRIFLPSAFTYAIGKGWITQDMATQIAGFIAAVAAAGGWSAVSNSNLNLAKTVAAMPDVQVHVGGGAPPELQTAARDTSIKDIIPSPSPAYSPPAQRK